jgi:hypothetical protein
VLSLIIAYYRPCIWLMIYNTCIHLTLQVSLTKSQPTNAKGVPDKATSTGQPVRTQEQFFTVLEAEMRKIDDFTKKMVIHIRNTLSKIDKELQNNLSDERKEQLQTEVRVVVLSTHEGQRSCFSHTLLRMHAILNFKFSSI